MVSSLEAVKLVASENDKIIVKQLNLSTFQAIDTTSYSQWIFSITPIKTGFITIYIYLTHPVPTDLGLFNKDYKVYEWTTTIIDSGKINYSLIWNEFQNLIITIIMCSIIIICRLIPKQVIITNINNFKNTNFWISGSISIVIYIIVVISFGVFKMLNINLYFTLLVFIGTILIYAAIAAVSLRDSGKLSEENFLSLMSMAIKKIPPLNWFDNKSDTKKD